MANPDKHIRKEVSGLLNNMLVHGIIIPCVGSEITGPVQSMHYNLLHSQTKQRFNSNKCSYQWECSILIDSITRFTGTGNPGSRVLVNDIEEEVIERMVDFSIPNLFSIEWESSTPADTKTNTENMFRQLIRYRIVINN